MINVSLLLITKTIIAINTNKRMIVPPFRYIEIRRTLFASKIYVFIDKILKLIFYFISNTLKFGKQGKMYNPIIFFFEC